MGEGIGFGKGMLLPSLLVLPFEVFQYTCSQSPFETNNYCPPLSYRLKERLLLFVKYYHCLAVWGEEDEIGDRTVYY